MWRYFPQHCLDSPEMQIPFLAEDSSPSCLCFTHILGKADFPAKITAQLPSPPSGGGVRPLTAGDMGITLFNSVTLSQCHVCFHLVLRPFPSPRVLLIYTFCYVYFTLQLHHVAVSLPSVLIFQKFVDIFVCPVSYLLCVLMEKYRYSYR